MKRRVAAREKKRVELGWSRRSSVCVAGALSGVLTLLAFPPVGLWVLAFVAPLPLVWAAGAVEGKRWGAAIAATIGMAPAWAWQEQWIFGVSAIGAPLLVVYLSLYAGGFVWLCSWARDRLRVPEWVVGPVVWAGLEMLRGEVVGHGYPWLLAGHPLVESAQLSAAGSVVGAYGVSFLMVVVAIGAYGVVVSKGRWRLVGAGLTACGAAAWAGLSMGPRVATDSVMRVAVVQTNVPQGVKLGWPPAERMRDLDRMLELTVGACEAQRRPELVVWPETMFPGAALDANSLNEERAADLSWVTSLDTAWPALRYLVYRGPDGIDAPVPIAGPFERGDRLIIPTAVASDSVLSWQGRLGVPFLIGAEGIDGLRLDVEPGTGAITEEHDAMYNSTYLIQGGRVVGERYDKMQLTPFGEVMPYISAWPWLEQTLLRIGVGAGGMAFNLDAGDRAVTHVVQTEAGLVRVATPICFEGIMPGVCRRLAYSGGERQADVLIQLTNEGWFKGFDAGREQHLQIVRWRAVELGTAVVRAANTGVSVVIGPDGQVLDRGVPEGDSRVDGVLAAEVPLAVGETLYARVGDLVGWVNLALLGGILVAGMVAGRGRQSPEPPGADEEGGQTSRPRGRRKDQA